MGNFKILDYKAIQLGNTIVPINNITNVFKITEPVYHTELNPTESYWFIGFYQLALTAFVSYDEIVNFIFKC